MSKRLLDAETRYPELEKLDLALMVASRKLRPYFHAHSIEVLTIPTEPSAIQVGSLRQAPEMGHRVGVVRHELPPPNDNQRASPSRFHSRVHLRRHWRGNEDGGSPGEKNFALTKGDAAQWTLYVDNA